MGEDEIEKDLIEEADGKESDDGDDGEDEIPALDDNAEPDAAALTASDDDDDFEGEEDEEEVFAAKPPPRKRTTTRGQGIMAGVTRAKLDDPKVAAEVWQALTDKLEAVEPKPYMIAELFHADDIVSHSKFGIGFVIATPGGTQAEILFADMVRRLVMGR
ncbi:MAG: hypothetical protein ACI81R_003279 [Bradymonadia bacterium]|jgi:hypothetical protein